MVGHLTHTERGLVPLLLVLDLLLHVCGALLSVDDDVALDVPHGRAGALPAERVVLLLGFKLLALFPEHVFLFPAFFLFLLFNVILNLTHVVFLPLYFIFIGRRRLHRLRRRLLLLLLLMLLLETPTRHAHGHVGTIVSHLGRVLSLFKVLRIAHLWGVRPTYVRGRSLSPRQGLEVLELYLLVRRLLLHLIPKVAHRWLRS